MKNYALIHAHSCYSFGDGAMTIESYVKKSKELGLPGISITEHGNMASSLKFYKECRKNSINPIIGIESYINEFRDEKLTKKDTENNEEYSQYDRYNTHLVLLAKNYNGYKNLLKISGDAFQNGFYYKPRTTSKIIFDNSEDIIVSTACIGSKFANILMYDSEELFFSEIKKYKDVFGNDFYLELQFIDDEFQKRYNQKLLEASKKFDIKCIIGLDAHYVDEEDFYLQQIKMLIHQQKKFEDLQKENNNIWVIEKGGYYIKNIDQLYQCSEKYGYNYSKKFIDNLLNNTLEINSKVNIEIPFYNFIFPVPNIENNLSPKDYFRKLCLDGFKNKLDRGIIKKEKAKQYGDQLKYEIRVIEKMNYSDYFLVIYDSLKKVRDMGGMVGAGRGSAVGSLVSFCLNITDVDPVENGLYFERFMNEARQDPPDIDCDISSDEQKLLEEELRKEYGYESVAHIANYTKFGSKSIVRDLSRLNGFDFISSNYISKLFDDQKNLENNWNVLRENQNLPQNIKKFVKENEEYILKWGSKLENQVRHVGSHASGVVVCKGNVYEHIPILKSKNIIMTAYQEGGDEREVSEIGLIKLDLLGLNTCSIINDTIKLINSRKNIDINKIFDMDKFDDKKVFEMFSSGRAVDIFQFGSSSMRKILIESKASNFIDITAINGLYRPAAIKAGFVNKYIKCKNNPSEEEYIHEKLRSILSPTHSVIIFQEQLMEILRDVGGFSLSESDNARKVLKYLHKANQGSDRIKDFDDVIEKFKDGAMKNGLSEKQAEALINQMSKYSEYSFARAHSAGYAANAYRQMYLKVYFPLEYFCCLLNRTQQDNIKLMIYECKDNNIDIDPISIEKSNYEFEISKNKIITGLKIIKGISKKDIDKIAELRPFVNIQDFFEKCFKNKVGKSIIESAIKLGLLDHLYSNRKSILNYYLSVKNKKFDKEKFDLYDFDSEEDFTDIEKSSFEIKYFGFYLNDHPMRKFKKILKDNNITAISEVEDSINIDCIAGILESFKYKKTKRGSNYIVAEISDEYISTNIKIWNGSIDDDKIGSLVILTDIKKDSYGMSTKDSKNINYLK